jgi:drug/metabolite transporter (DMT)-like permease
MAAAQASVMLAASTALLLLRGGELPLARLPSLDAEALMALLYLGLLASVVVVTLQAWGQQRVDAMRSAIVFGLEPVFAALTAWALLGEHLGWVGWGGAAMIVTALVFSQSQPAPGSSSRREWHVGHGARLAQRRRRQPLRTAAMSSSLGYSPSNQ